MAKYLVLIYEDETARGTGPRNPEYDKHWTFVSAHKDVIDAGEGLQPTSTATSMRKDASGEYVVTDGPFVETKEALGGFYLIEAADLDAAITLAREIPSPYGGLELRPVMVFS